MPPPAAMSTVLEVFNEDRLAHPLNPHVFVVPRLMTNQWRKSLPKDVDIMFTVQTGVSFWGALQHEPLLVAITLPLSHVPSYRGPWLAKGTLQARKLACELETGFKFGKNPGHTGLSELDGSLCGLWVNQEERSRKLLYFNGCRRI